jgi:DNA-binding transcriptional regulator of glucitol operon
MEKIILTLVFTLALQFSNIVAQEKNESVDNLVSTLKQKVLLNDDQTTSIEKVLTELVSKSKTVEDKNSLIQDAQKKVESYLDRKQKMKYDIIKNEWWKQVSALL